MTRLAQFDLAQPRRAELAVRRHVPPLSLGQVRHLTPALQAEHRRWLEDQAQVAVPERQRTRCLQLAATLLELGEDRGAAERQLLAWGFGPVLTREAVAWARGRRGPDRPQAASERPPDSA